jgi:hypothetical protein
MFGIFTCFSLFQGVVADDMKDSSEKMAQDNLARFPIVHAFGPKRNLPALHQEFFG